MTDANIDYIWLFLKRCADEGWLYTGHRPMTWCPRCGTSLSQHEMPRPTATATSCIRRCTSTCRWSTPPTRRSWCGRRHRGRCRRTSPPPSTRGRLRRGRRRPGSGLGMEGRVEAVFGESTRVVKRAQGRRAGRLAVRRPVRPPGRAGGRRAPDRRVGRGRRRRRHRHRPHRARLRRGGLRPRPRPGPARARAGRRGRRVLRGRRRAARPAHARRQTSIIDDLGQQGRLLRAEQLEHRYPSCWRCGTELIFRLVDEWFISCDGDPRAHEGGQPRRRVDARLLRQAHGGLAQQHGRLVHLPQALLGPAAAVLPRPVAAR